ncbi:coiled-coil domain-containing protein 78 [Limosa lapponica baueri]|uniref:Coiled-coil domain-containing protein 78 n=1 Tax=Limosa lapponica baueri TaxID=1758121 RepID=A0A2I0T7D0_LIMLA|nr:coiled-coil domain-containing protein 78 [Limosa lapponica baueri]
MDFAENERVQLQDRSERLYGLGDLQERTGKLAGSKPDPSARMGLSEEEKLQISKELVDLQIETNKMKEQYETENFELKNMVVKNEELSQELLNLANARSNRGPTVADESSAELERVRATVRRLSARGAKLLGNQDHIKVELEKLKKTYDLQQQKLEERVMVMGKELQEAKGATGDTQRKLAEQSAVLLTSQSQLQEVEVENSQLQLRLKQLNEEYRSRLAQYIKDVAVGTPSPRGSPELGRSLHTGTILKHLLSSREWGRVERRLEMDYMDSKSSKAPADHAPMKRFVDNMLKDIRASYKSREEQLAGAARGYKKRMKNLVKKHENLLIAYGLQREQIRSLGSSAMDCGPAELHFSITDPELLTNTTRELNRLREEKAKLEMQLRELQKERPKETSAFPLSPEQ